MTMTDGMIRPPEHQPITIGGTTPPPPPGGGGVPLDDGAWTPVDPASRVCIHIHTIHPQPGDVLVLTLPAGTSAADEHMFTQRVKARFPDHQLVVLMQGHLHAARPFPPAPVKPEPQWLGGPPWPKLEPVETWQNGVFDDELQPVAGSTFGLFVHDFVYDNQTRTVKQIVDMGTVPDVFARTYLFGDDLWRDLVDGDGKVLSGSQHIWALPGKTV